MKNLIFALLMVLAIGGLNAQGIDSMLKVYHRDYAQQKLFMHFDKGTYISGEPVYFKAYIFEGTFPTDRSHNFYAELLNDSGRVIQRKVYPIFESSAAGNFDLPENARSGTYMVRAYTKWMLNFDSAFIYTRYLYVAGKGNIKAGVQAATKPATFSLTLFPEGGYLVTGLASVVAFKANDQYGLPIATHGKVIDSKGNTITQFSSEHNGMGRFTITPAKNETYQAVWSGPGEVAGSTDLPLPKPEGYVMSVKSINDNLIVSLSRTFNIPNSYNQVWLLATQGGAEVYKVKINMETNTFKSGGINIKELPAGVLQITLFSAKNEPLAERIIMVNNQNYSFETELSATILDANKRAENEMEIVVGDSLLSNLSVAVVDEEVGGGPNTPNIISTMLLTGDIRGYVHDPAYYFSNTTDSTLRHLDLVMLTHGWRRYNWQALNNYQVPEVKYPTDEWLTFSAKVLGLDAGTELHADEKLVTIFQYKDTTTSMMLIPKTGKNEFSDVNIMIVDTLKVSYQFSLDKKLNKRAKLHFETGAHPGLPGITPKHLPLFFQTDSSGLGLTHGIVTNIARNYSKLQGNANVLLDVTVRTRPKTRIEQLSEKYSSGMFTGDAVSFDFTEGYNFGTSLANYLTGRVAGLTIYEDGGEITMSWRGSNTALFINEIRSATSMLNTLSPSDIALIKIFRPPFMGASYGGAGGAIAIYTRKGIDVQDVSGSGLPGGTITGYSVRKEFYMPDHGTRQGSSIVAADLRTTLYWNPYIFTDSTQQKVKFRFYNNDFSRAFRVVLQGFNQAGKLVYIEKVFRP